MAKQDFDEQSIKNISQPGGDPFSPHVSATLLLEEKADKLHERLRQCKKTIDWADYENICADILEFSLADCLSDTQPRKQQSTWDNTQRMDIIMYNNPSRATGFWHEIRYGGESDTSLLIFECKNYEKGITPKEVMQAHSYEIRGGRHFRCILTREEPSEPAYNAIRHWWHYYQVLIIVLTDVEMHELIDARLKGPEEVDRIFHATYQGEKRAKWYQL